MPEQEEKNTNKWMPWLIMAFLSVVWGSSFILIKKSLIAFSYYEVGLLRIGISTLLFLPFALKTFRKLEHKDLKYILIVALTGSGIPSFLFPLAQTHISSSVAGMLNSLSPLFTLVLGIAFFGTTLKWSKVGGIAIGLFGATLLIFFGEELGSLSINWYSLFAVLATLCYATSVNTVGKHLKHLNPIITSGASFLMIGIPVLISILFTDIRTIVQTHPDGWSSLGYVSILAVFGTVISTIVFFQLVRLTNALFASTIAYVIPIVALFWGALDGEYLGIVHVVAMVLILLGVYLSKK